MDGWMRWIVPSFAAPRRRPSSVIVMGPIRPLDILIDPQPPPTRLSSLVAPEDRRAYLQSFFRLIFTNTTDRQREFIKARPRVCVCVFVLWGVWVCVLTCPLLGGPASGHTS